jgi:hypothetical protein
MFGRKYCPHCGNTVSAIQREAADDGLTSSFLLAEVVGWCVGGLSIAMGFVWWPGYIIGVVAVLWLVVRHIQVSAMYYCGSCSARISYRSLTHSPIKKRFNQVVDADAQNAARHSL